MCAPAGAETGLRIAGARPDEREFAVKNNEVYLIEVNPRAARPFRSSPKPPAYRWQKWRRVCGWQIAG